MKLKLAATLLIAPMWITGCASFSTTPISRNDNNGITGDSNGLHRLICCKSRPFRGVPVKIKTRTHVDVWVKEKYVLKRVSGDKVNLWEEKALEGITPGLSTEVPQIPKPIRLLYIETAPVMGEQVVITDFKRPASGTIDLTVDFTNDQYFKKVDSTIVDSTITDSTALLTTILSGTGAIKTKGFGLMAESVNTPDLQWQERTVAYQRFDINAPDYERQVEDFVNQHLNNCNTCSDFASPSFFPPAEHKGY